VTPAIDPPGVPREIREQLQLHRCSQFHPVRRATSPKTSTISILWRLWHIAQIPVTATGVVTHLDCSNHGHVDYSFRVDGTPIEGRPHFVDGIACQQLRTGQPIAIYYERAAPENNYALVAGPENGNRAMTAFWTASAILAALAFLGPMFLVLVWTVFSRVAARFQ
jgi:hypothetical protein